MPIIAASSARRLAAAAKETLTRQSVSSFFLAAAVLFALSLSVQEMPEERETALLPPPEAPVQTDGDDDGDDYSPDFADDIPPPNAVTDGDADKEPEKPWLEYRIRRGDNMDKILRKINTADDIRLFVLSQKLKTHRRLRIGDVVYFKLEADGRANELLYKTSPDYYFRAGYDAAGAPWAKEEAPDVRAFQRRAGGVIDSSLFVAADAAGMSDAAISQLIEVLETQIDFYRDVRKGDSFRVIYEEWRDQYDSLVKMGDIIAFEYHNRLPARPRRIVGVVNEARDHYYTPQGESMQRAFLPAPLKFRRISSRFSLKRFHPVLKVTRPHRGVDYAAPSGTPVRSTADGTIIKVAKERGFGNVVMIKHFNIYTTVYAHLRGFARGVRKGRRIKQGDIVGYVGQTGLSTGPHLHYEFRVRGKHKNPLTVDMPKQLPPLSGDQLATFQQHSKPILSDLKTINLL